MGSALPPVRRVPAAGIAAWLARSQHLAHLGFIVATRLRVRILLIAGGEKLPAFGVVAQRIVGKPDVAEGVRRGRIELQNLL